VGRLEGRIALVSGCGRGIGRAITLAFAREGAALGITDVDEASGEQTAGLARASGGPVHLVTGDVGVREDCDRIVAEVAATLGGIDVLANVAAWARTGVAITDTDDALHQRTMDVCMSSVFWMMRAAHPHMKARGGGSIINFASNAGSEGMAYGASYAAAKEAIRGFSRSAAREWARDGIRVNVIRPIALSPGTQGFLEANPRAAKAQLAQIPLGRIGDCDEDIAPAAVFLASDESRYLTAVTLPVDGGGGTER